MDVKLAMNKPKKCLLIVIIALIPSSQQFFAETPVLQPVTNFLQAQRVPNVLPIHGRSNEIFDTTQSNVNVSPYWADDQGRRPNDVPQVSSNVFKPRDPFCNTSLNDCNFNSPYRTMSGHCNNILHPEFGSAEQPMPRILPPSIDKGFMRTESVTGKLLPNPRLISLAVRNIPPRPRTNHNMMVMQIGQFIDHDYTVVHEIRETGGEKKNCKDCTSWRDPACAPIPVPRDDPFLPSRGYTSGIPKCLPFSRSTALEGRDNFGHIIMDQVNSNSAFLDLSTVYGSHNCRETQLRTFNTGQLIGIKQPKDTLKSFLPLEGAENFEECRSREKKCFRAGDDRNNEHIGILAIHILYMREHNKLALNLKKLNPHWSDERLFQEARRINIAKYQHTIYSEFLPALIGNQKMTDYRLHPERSGYYLGYNDQVNPGVLNEFSTSAFRVGHTMIPDHFPLIDKRYFPTGSLSLLQIFHNITMSLQPGICDAILRGFTNTRLNGVDLALEEVILDKLFEKPDVIHSGEDLFARNIARGRDHGIPPYVMYKAACGGGGTNDWDDLSRIMSKSTVDAIRPFYEKVEDVDLYVGGLAEDPVPGGLVGPTFACIIAYQFLNSRRGDRFWYENSAAGFTPAQLHTIRESASLSRLLCDNMDHEVFDGDQSAHIDVRIPREAFYVPSHIENPLWRCDRIPSIDLTLWTETHIDNPVPCTYLGITYQWNKFVPVSRCLTCLCQPDGRLKCEANISGCTQQNTDDYCRLVCDESHTFNSGYV